MATAAVSIYILFGLLILYMGVITFGISVASAQIAKTMATRKFAVVFAVITIIYLALETIFQFIIGSAVLSLSTPTMFFAFGFTLACAACVFAALALVFRMRATRTYVPLPVN